MTTERDAMPRIWKGAAIAAAFLIAGLSIRSAALDEWSESRPQLVAVIAPHSGGALIYRALQKAQSENLRISPETATIAREAAVAAPLAAEPLLMVGIAKSASGQGATAGPLFLEARNRNPRLPIVRLMVLDNFLRANKDKEALGEIAVLFRLLPLAREPLVQELARRAHDPELKLALGRTLRTDSNLLSAVLQQLSAEGADPTLILELAGQHGVANQGDRDFRWQRADRQWQSALVRSLTRKGDYRRAHSVWTRFFAPKATVEGNYVYDPEFQDGGSLPPFGWRLSVSDAGVAEPAHGNGLYVEFYGRKNAIMAQQTMLMMAGTYRLVLTGTQSAAATDQPLRWLLTCLPSDNRILDWPYSAGGQTERPVGATFTVPATGCDAQSLSLVGSAGEFPRSQTVTIEKIGIFREN